MKLKEFKKMQKLFGSLTPEEKQEVMEALKDEDTSVEATPQNTLKQGDAEEGGDKGSIATKEGEASQDANPVQSNPSSQNSQNQEGNKQNVDNVQENTSSNQEDMGSDGLGNVEPVGNEDARSIDDFLSKKEFTAQMEAYEQKFKALLDENKKLKDEVSNLKDDNNGLKEKYEGTSFGDVSQQFNSENGKKKEVESFDDFYKTNIMQK